MTSQEPATYLKIAQNVLLQYGELINESQKHKVQEKMEQLDEAIKNERPCDSLAGEMMQLLDELMFEEVNGVNFSSLFGLAVGAAGLVCQAEQKDLAKAQKLSLRERLDDTIIELKYGNTIQAISEMIGIMEDSQCTVLNLNNFKKFIRCPFNNSFCRWEKERGPWPECQGCAGSNLWKN